MSLFQCSKVGCLPDFLPRVLHLFLQHPPLTCLLYRQEKLDQVVSPECFFASVKIEDPSKSHEVIFFVSFFLIGVQTRKSLGAASAIQTVKIVISLKQESESVILRKELLTKIAKLFAGSIFQVVSYITHLLKLLQNTTRFHISFSLEAHEIPILFFKSNNINPHKIDN